MASWFDLLAAALAAVAIVKLLDIAYQSTGDQKRCHRKGYGGKTS